ncbi:class II aldolase/adducin family protein [uncultured Zhongshania sp.]|uniref:class II aldolase/adducin family protein n=1 Tax=uncultured Zhongshania sp. TaxID=1642288 RepID=UPI0025DDD621|nr:class II aldolase/adducin family protein [uncultured Zhongshania sp.]
MEWEQQRAQLVSALHGLSRAELSPGASGNASVKTADGGMLISATGQIAGDARPADLVYIKPDGEITDGQLRPSSEWRMHWQIYLDHPEAGGIVHCHSRYATVLACQRKEIPAFHYMIAVAGGSSIPCAPYALYGSQALSERVSHALKQRKACLLANHGQIAYGSDPTTALTLAKEVEELAANYYFSLQHGGPTLLSEQEMAEVLAQYADYGQQR